MAEQTLTLEVRNRQVQGDNVLVLDLADSDGRELPAFDAGAHVDLYLGEGLIRQYSLCGDPADRSRYRLGILRDPKSRGGSIAAHQLLTVGRRVQVGLPRNLFPLNGAARHSLLIGGGIGVTPMIAMAYALSAGGQSFALHYCARSRGSSAFLAELAATPFAQRVTPHFDDEDAAQRLDIAALLAAAPAGTHVYVCGPAGFMDWVIDACHAAGLPPETVHREYFEAEIKTGGAAFDVVASRSGKTVRVEENETILDALGRIGIKVPVSCEKGVCGTCLCTVLEGEPDHRDVYLTDEEKADNDQIILCCSRAKSDSLVLDI